MLFHHNHDVLPSGLGNTDEGGGGIFSVDCALLDLRARTLDGDLQKHVAVFHVVDLHIGYAVWNSWPELHTIGVKTHPYESEQDHSQVGGGGPRLPCGRFPKDDSLATRLLHSAVDFS